MATRKLAHFSPGKIIIFSYLLLIVLGTAALALPCARIGYVSLLDLIFTATSATCVTGLFTISLDNFSSIGHGILLFLIQVGGLGLITLSIFLISLFVNFGFATQLMAGKLLEIESWQNVKKLIISIILVTISCELIGTLLLFSTLRTQFSTKYALFISLFHAVSSFCNAGITLFSDGMHHFGENYIVLITTGLLMFFGGLGFVTWNEGVYYLFSLKKKKRYTFSLHSKIILYGSTLLITGTVLLLLLTEYNHAFTHMNPLSSFANALFHAISFRSGGFLNIAFHTFQPATVFLIMFITFIGASPGSTGSGIKITTFTIFLATIKAAISGRTSVELKNRSIALDQVYSSIAIISLSAGWIIGTTFLLLLTEKSGDFFSLLLEAVSAFTTLGISNGTTELLSVAGKILIILSMIIGRIGSLALILFLRDLTQKKAPESAEFSYPEERVMLS